MSTTTREIEDYVAAVHAALTDLPDTEREDLLDDLPQHLADVLSDGSGTLTEMLGTPESYAVELRASAGLDSTPNSRPWLQLVRHRLVSADARLGSALNYDRFVDLVRALAPGLWLIRGYLLVQLFTNATSRFGSHALVPEFGSSRVAGGVLLAAACSGSVWLGRRGFRREWQRVVSVLLGLALLWYAVVLVRQIDMTATVYVDNGPSDGTSDLSNIYPVGPDGTVLKNVRLYDQDGNPVQLNDAICADGGVADEDNGDGSVPAATSSAASPDGAQLYPLTCVANQGPFGSRTAPALPATSTTPASTPSSSSGAPVSPSPSVAPSATPRGTATTGR